MAERQGLLGRQQAQSYEGYYPRAANPVHEIAAVLLRKILGDPVQEAKEKADLVLHTHELINQGIDPFKEGGAFGVVDPKKLEAAAGSDVAAMFRGVVQLDSFKAQQKQRKAMDDIREGLIGGLRDEAYGQTFEAFKTFAQSQEESGKPIPQDTQFGELRGMQFDPNVGGQPGAYYERGPTRPEMQRGMRDAFFKLPPEQQALAGDYGQELTAAELGSIRTMGDQNTRLGKAQDFAQGTGRSDEKLKSFLPVYGQLIDGGVSIENAGAIMEAFAQGDEGWYKMIPPGVNYSNPDLVGRGGGSGGGINGSGVTFGNIITASEDLALSEKEQLEFWNEVVIPGQSNETTISTAQDRMIGIAARRAVVLTQAEATMAGGMSPEEFQSRVMSRTKQLAMIYDPGQGLFGKPSWQGLETLPGPMRKNMENRITSVVTNTIFPASGNIPGGHPVGGPDAENETGMLWGLSPIEKLGSERGVSQEGYMNPMRAATAEDMDTTPDAGFKFNAAAGDKPGRGKRSEGEAEKKRLRKLLPTLEASNSKEDQEMAFKIKAYLGEQTNKEIAKKVGTYLKTGERKSGEAAKRAKAARIQADAILKGLK